MAQNKWNTYYSEDKENAKVIVTHKNVKNCYQN